MEEFRHTGGAADERPAPLPDRGRVREARGRVQARLGLVSAAIWFTLVFGAAPLLGFSHATRAPLVLLLGFSGLLVAALPWLTYRRLVDAELRRSAPRPPA